MRDEIFEIIKEAVEDLNEDLDYESLEDVSDNTVLFDGSDDSIDSLSLVSLVTTIEKKIKKALKKEVILADEESMARPAEERPYRNVGALLEFAIERAEGK